VQCNTTIAYTLTRVGTPVTKIADWWGEQEDKYYIIISSCSKRKGELRTTRSSPLSIEKEDWTSIDLLALFIS